MARQIRSSNRRRTLGLGLLAATLGPLGPLGPPGARAAALRKPVRLGSLVVVPESCQFFERYLQRAGLQAGRDYLFIEQSAPSVDGLYEAARALLAQGVDLILALSTREARAAQQATRMVPIVLMYGLAPEEVGFAVSLGKPGGNITGTVAYPLELIGKALQLLRELHPRLDRLALLLDDGLFAPIFQREATRAAEYLRIETHSFKVGNDADLRTAFAQAERLRINGLYMAHDLHDHYEAIAKGARALRLPTLYPTIPPVRVGGLLGVAPDLPRVYRTTADIVVRLLAGARAPDTPIEQPTRYVVGLNLGTAKALGLAVPPSLRLRATFVVD